MVEDMRSHPRIDVEPDFCVVETLQNERYLGVVRNVSRTGALVDVGDVANQAPTLGETTVSFISTPGFLSTALLGVTGRTVWVKDALLGVRFHNPLPLTQKDLTVLQEHLEAPEGPDWEKF